MARNVDESNGQQDAVSLVADAHASLGEGPVWDEGSHRLVWTDILGGTVHAFDPVTGCDMAVSVDQPVGAIVARSAGGYVAAVRDGFATIDLETGSIETFAAVESDEPGNRMNDGKCDRAGRFWAGTMADDATPGRGALYRLDVDGTVSRIRSGVTVSNGLAWSADDSTMYYIDTGLDRIDAFAFDLATGQIGRAEPFVAFDPSEGRPDGMTIDAEGYLWVAIAGGWCVRRYGPGGRLDREVAIPARLVTSCAFGGDDLADLYVTTAGYDVTPGEPLQPHAGGLFRLRPGAPGLAPNPYRG